jgi:hypothetical protein
MSFGFGIGDFIAVIEFAEKVRTKFVAAPTQFKAISNEFVTHPILQLTDVNCLIS